MGDSTERHTTRAEARANVSDGFDLIDGDRLAVRLDFELIAQARVRTIVAVRLVGAPELIILFTTTEANSLVKKLRHLLVVAVVFQSRLDLEHTARLNLGHLFSLTRESGLDKHVRLRGNFIHGETTDAGNGALEGGVDDFRPKTVALENLRALVRGDQRDTHLRQDLLETLVEGILEVDLHTFHRDITHLTALDGGLDLRGLSP